MDGICFAEVQYYFIMISQKVKRALVLMSLYSPPDPAWLAGSFATNISYTSMGDAGLYVIDIKDIWSVVAMTPWQGRFFMVEKIGLDIAHLGGYKEDIEVQ